MSCSAGLPNTSTRIDVLFFLGSMDIATIAYTCHGTFVCADKVQQVQLSPKLSDLKSVYIEF